MTLEANVFGLNDLCQVDWTGLHRKKHPMRPKASPGTGHKTFILIV